MKGFLLDENLPASLQLPTSLPIFLVTEISPSPPDTVVWQYARDRSLVIITKDADFSHRILVSDPPPWIVHVRLGNVRFHSFVERLVALWPAMEELLPKHKLVTLLADRIEAIE